MRIGYADPPYPGCAHMYRDHPDYAGEVDHKQLIERLQDEFDGWVLHTHVPGLRMMEQMGWIPNDGVRICAWFKSFAAFKRNVSVAYAWEPVIIKAARKPTVSKRLIYRDFVEVPDSIKHPITMKKGLAGAKPPKVCQWAFELVGADPHDALDDLFPGTGAVSMAWVEWCHAFSGVVDLENCKDWSLVPELPAAAAETLPTVRREKSSVDAINGTSAQQPAPDDHPIQ